MTSIAEVAERISLLRCSHVVRVGIDGFCAAGKPTLADAAEAFGAQCRKAVAYAKGYVHGVTTAQRRPLQMRNASASAVRFSASAGPRAAATWQAERELLRERHFGGTRVAGKRRARGVRV